MFKMSQEVLRSILRELDQAVYSHGRWYKELTRSIICRLSHDQRDLEDDSYRPGSAVLGNGTIVHIQMN